MTYSLPFGLTQKPMNHYFEQGRLSMPDRVAAKTGRKTSMNFLINLYYWIKLYFEMDEEDFKLTES